MDNFKKLIDIDDQILELEAQANKLREEILHEMMGDGLQQERKYGFLFSLKQNKPKIDYDKKKCPDEYTKTKVVPDEDKIRAELEAGKILLWAALDDSKPFSLIVRRDAKFE